MLARLVVIVFVLALLLGLSTGAQAQAVSSVKVALVIGNSSYEATTPLKNPKEDAALIGAALENAGFEVTLRLDLGYPDLVRELGVFQRLASLSDSAVIYYAGHGMEIDRQNYLIPVDAQLEFVSDADFQTVPLQLLQRAVADARVLGLVIVDACRNNPFAIRLAQADQSRGIGNGLARVEPGGRTLVALAAREGTFAFDGRGSNSPYALALDKALRTPGLEIGRLFRQLHDDVVAATNGAQEPVLFGTLTSEDYYFLPPAPAEEPAPTETAATEATAVEAAKLQVELAFWQSADAGGRAEDYALYLEVYPEGQFAPLARAKVARLSELAAATTTPAPTGPAPTAEAAYAPATLAQTAPDLPVTAEATPPSISADQPFLAAPAEPATAPQQLAIADSQPPRLPNAENAQPGQIASSLGALPDDLGLAIAPGDLPPQTDLTGTDLIIAVQTALARANCDPGPIDGIWGGSSLRALRSFSAARPDLALADSEPDAALLLALSSAQGPVCPEECREGEQLVNGQCIKTASCPQGQELDSKGECHEPPRSRVTPVPQPGGSSCRIFNGRRIC